MIDMQHHVQILQDMENAAIKVADLTLEQEGDLQSLELQQAVKDLEDAKTALVDEEVAIMSGDQQVCDLNEECLLPVALPDDD